MTTIDTLFLPPDWRLSGLWPEAARLVRTWLAGRCLAPRDAIVLLPFAALLAPARAAMAAGGGWQPRIETPQTLAAALRPPQPATPGACLGNDTHDHLTAMAMLGRAERSAGRIQLDANGMAHRVTALLEAAQALREAAGCQAPDSRAAFWSAARGAAMSPGPFAATESLLLRAAVEWAAMADGLPGDGLFTIEPSAWVVIQLGGPDPLAEAVLRHGAERLGTPGLRLVADATADEPWAPVAAAADLRRVVCDSAEGEAQAAASAVIAALNAGRAPVAVAALDRAGVRRIRALLGRRGVPLIDETGWRLSTTPAAWAVVAPLRAALPGAGPDARLAWLKTRPAAARSGSDAMGSQEALDALEAHWRSGRPVPGMEAGLRLWADAHEQLRALAVPSMRPLSAWLEALRELLVRGGSMAHLAASDAGAQVLAALGWTTPVSWLGLASEVDVDLAGFAAWLEGVLDATPFLPLPDPGAAVVLTPLARAFGRPFGEIVVPGADIEHLGAVDNAPSLIPEPMARALGIERAEAKRTRQRLALSALLRAPRVTLLRRRRAGDEPLADSPLVEWLALARAEAGAPAWPPMPWQPLLHSVPARRTARPLPIAAAALPATLSASHLEALRACPYRFFACAVLRLDEPDELEAALEKRDYGSWLHGVLHRFHESRHAGLSLPDADQLPAAADADQLPAAADADQLLAAAEAETRALGLDAAELLPYRAGFEHFVPAYIAWLQAREAGGWYWAEGERTHRVTPALLNGLALRGRIDRMDAGPDGARQLLDYKTGSLQSLRDRVKAPLEDTQLTFYAALLGADTGLSAAYVALDDAQAPSEVVHPHVADTVVALLEGLGAEWRRMQAGAPLPALGAGPVCDTCTARGLCRRDHWGAA